MGVPCTVVAAGLVALSAAFYLAFGVWAPQLGFTDTAAFKDAAVNLATGRGFVTAFGFANHGPEFLAYAGHPPAYSWLAGQWFSIFGVSVESNTWFEGLLRVLLVVMVAAAVLPAFPPGRATITAALLLALGLPFALVNVPVDRPDALGLTLAIAAGVIARRPGLAGMTGAAALAGLALLVSPLAGIFVTLSVALVWFTAPGARVSFAAATAIGASLWLAPLALAGSALHAGDPTYWPRFLAFVLTAGDGETTQHAAGAGQALAVLTDPAAWWARLSSAYTTPHHYAHAASLAATAGGVLVWSFVGDASRRVRAAVAAFTCTVAVLVLVPFSWNPYYAATASLFILTLWLLVARRDAGRVGLSVLAVLVTINAMPGGLDLLSRVTAAPTLEVARQRLVAHPVKDINGDGRRYLLADPALFMLLREAGYEAAPIDPPPGAAQALIVDGYAFGYIGTGSHRPARPSWWPPSGEPTLLSEAAGPRPVEFLGLTLSRSSRTWEPELWQR